MFTYLTKEPKLLIVVPAGIQPDLVKKYYLKPIKSLLGNKDFLIAEIDVEVPQKEIKQIVLNNVIPVANKHNIKAVYLVGAKLMKCISTKSPVSTLATYISKDGINYAYLPNAEGVYVNTNIAKQINLAIKIAYNMQVGLPVVHNRSANMVVLNKAKESDLDKLLYTDTIFIDIEAFSLDFWRAGIGTICFKNHKGVTVGLYVDYMPADVYLEYYKGEPILEIFDKTEAVRINNTKVKKVLAKWISNNKRTLIAHNAGYDFTVLVYELFMKDLEDREGLIDGLEILTRSFEDTFLLTYIKNNDTQHTPHNLKAATMSFMGNYGIDVKDITTQKPKDLLYYNGDDVIATEFLYDNTRNIPKEQEYLYEEVFKEGTILFIDIMLSGLPFDKQRLDALGSPLVKEVKKLYKKIRSTKVVKSYQEKRKKRLFDKKHKEWKTKKVPWEEFPIDEFNPNSGPQLAELLFEEAKLPIVETTKKGNPSTDKKTLDILESTTKNKEIKGILKSLKKLSESSMLLSTLIPAFNNYSVKKYGTHFVMGKFKFPGAVSGRPSSSSPNLLNTPSTGSAYAKPFKDCVRPPKGTLLLGADYASLEHRVNALFTKDPNMLMEYESGLDGHSFRAFFYFKKQLKKRDPKLVAAIEKELKKNKQFRG